MSESIPKAVLQINNARQILALVKERPCINPHSAGVQRAAPISYAELSVVERMLNDAVNALAPKFEGGLDVHGNFVRPMGATPLEGHTLDEVHVNALYRCSCGAEFDNMNAAVTHAANARKGSR